MEFGPRALGARSILADPRIRDIRDRIRAAGFDLTEFTAVEPDVHIYGLMRGETLFIGTKPARPAQPEGA